jgi:F-type H+-transporting ATPase subunit b
VLTFITPGYAQTEPHAEPPAGELHAETEAHGGEHDVFPPFDPATFGSQLFWLVICFGALYFLMSRVALPRIGSILAERDNRIAGDLATAGRMKQETDAAIAAYEQALAEARKNAHSIGQTARNDAKAEIEAHRARVEAELQQRLAAAEASIAGVKSRALGEVDAIATDAAEAMVEVLLGTRASVAEVALAVRAAMTERT